jgi:hypothetical protein
MVSSCLSFYRIECLKLSILDKEKGEGIIVSAGKDGAVKYWDIKK